MQRNYQPHFHPLNPTKPVKIVAISDLHGHLPEIPPCDICIIAGDIGPATNSYHQAGRFAIHWIRNAFNNWLKSIPAKHILGIAGNHDFVAQDFPHLMTQLHWTYLLDTKISLLGLSIHGSPFTKAIHPDYPWAFQNADHKLTKHWRHISKYTDILVTHGPPLHILDQNHQGTHCGSLSLKQHLQRVNPTLHLFGHIHENSGQTLKSGNTTFANVSYLDHHYNPTNQIQVFNVVPQNTESPENTAFSTQNESV